MIIEDGKFYFIKDEFFDVFKDYGLMVNKDNGNNWYPDTFDKTVETSGVEDKNISWYPDTFDKTVETSGVEDKNIRSIV